MITLKKNLQTLKAGSLVLLAFLFDQLTKYILYTNSGSGMIRLVQVQNSGAIFGFFAGNNTVILLLAGLVLGVIYYFKDSIHPVWAPYIIIGAGLGNIFDRIVFGYVRDFIAVQGFSVFNGADILLTVSGAAILAYEFFQNSSRSLTSSK